VVGARDFKKSLKKQKSLKFVGNQWKSLKIIWTNKKALTIIENH